MSEVVAQNRDPRPPQSQVESWLGDLSLEMLPNNTSIRSLPLMPPETPYSITNLRSEPIGQTVDFALSLLDSGRTVVPHVSASRISRQKAREVGHVLRSGSIDHVFIMKGDNDGDPASYASTLELLEDWRDNGITFEKLGVAGHPEGLATVPNHELDQMLKDKQAFTEATGAETYVVTQMCFDPAAIASWTRRVREAGIHLPIIVGLPGPVDMQRLIKYSGVCGVGNSAARLGSDPDLSSRGSPGAGRVFDPYRFLEKLAGETDASMGIRGTYFFTFNEPGKTLGWLQSVREKERLAI